MSVRVVVVGKGGVGKTTVTALLARTLARSGRPVVAVDADEQMNLATTLGIDPAVAGSIVPLADDAGYVDEKTGAAPGSGGGLLRLNPDVSDVVDRRAVSAPDGVRLLVMGGVRRAGGGCLCAEHTLLAATVEAMGARRGDVVVMDTHAGAEHFGRALARGFDQALVVTDPTLNAAQVALSAARLAAELGIGTVRLAVNRAAGTVDAARALGHLESLGGFDFDSVSVLPYDRGAVDGEPSVGAVLGGSPLAAAVARLAGTVVSGPGGAA